MSKTPQIHFSIMSGSNSTSISHQPNLFPGYPLLPFFQKGTPDSELGLGYPGKKGTWGHLILGFVILDVKATFSN